MLMLSTPPGILFCPQSACQISHSFFRYHLDITSTGRPSLITSLKWILPLFLLALNLTSPRA